MVPKLSWSVCGTSPYGVGTSNCQEWNTAGWSKEVNLQGGATVSTNGQYLYLGYVREADRIYDTQQNIYDRASLAPLGAFRSREVLSKTNDTCQLATSLRGTGGPTLFAFSPAFSFALGTPDELMNASMLSQFAPAYDAPKDIAHDIGASATTLAFTSFAGIVRVKLADRSWVRAKRFVEVPIVIGDDVIVNEKTAGWTTLSRVEANGDVTVLRAPPQRQMWGSTSDGTSMYWMEQFGDPDPMAAQTHFEIWRSVYTHDVAAFNANAERIVELDGTFGFGTSFVFNGVFMATLSNSAMVVRLSDKRVKLFTIAPGVQQVWPFYVDQKGLWYRAEITRQADVHYGKVGIDT
jgi:hypothetical protein